MDNPNSNHDHNEHIRKLGKSVVGPYGDYPESDSSEPIAPRIADDVNVLLVKPSAPDRFREKCLEFAKSLREFREKERLNHFQIVSNCMGVSHVSGLKGKGKGKGKTKPNTKTAKQLISYLQNFFLLFARIRIQHAKEYCYSDDIFDNKDLAWDSLRQQQDDASVKRSLRIGHLEQCFDWLTSLNTKGLCWEWDEWRCFGYNWDTLTKRDGEVQKATGWGVKLTVPELAPMEEDPWPYGVVGHWRRDTVTQQENLPKPLRTARHPDTESGCDLPAMYMLLTLVHSWYYSTPVIVTPEIKAEAPELEEDGNIGGGIRCILKEESDWPGFAEDLKTAWIYVKDDLDNIAEITGEDRKPKNASHSPDFRSVVWHGDSYSFTPTQAASVGIMWEAWEKGTPDVGDATLIKESGSESKRLVDVFKNHPAWSTMIQQGKTKGSHRLTCPEKP